MVCDAKRIRNLYLPRMTAVTPKLSTITPPKGLASLSTINAAITLGVTPLQTCPPPAGQTSLSLLTHRGWKPLPQPSSSQSLQLGGKDGHIPGRSSCLVHNAA